MENNVKKLFEELFINYPIFIQCKKEIESAYSILVNCYEHNGKVLVCGNGGSAADSEHIVGELMKEFLIKRPIPANVRNKIVNIDSENGDKISDSLQSALPAVSLVSQTSISTAFMNDVNSDMVFAQQVYGYAQPNDTLIAISTSGNSLNVYNAAVVAKAVGVNVIALTGKSGGKLTQQSDVSICVPSDITFRIQEYHLPIYHMLCAMVEENLFGK